MFKRQNGTTLIELIVVIVFIGIIALCTVPAFANYRRQTIRDSNGDKLLPADNALQFGVSAIGSLSELGSGTPGTGYISDGISNLYAVCVYGGPGKVRMLRYDAGKQWEER